MNFWEFKKNVLCEYNKYFPDSLCEIYIFKGFGKMLVINFRLASGAKECASQIIGNDCFRASFAADLPNNYNPSDNLPSNITLTSNSHCYVVKPENKHLYCDYKNVPFRKVSGDPDKVLNALKKYMCRFHASFMADYHGRALLDRDYELVRAKGYKTTF